MLKENTIHLGDCLDLMPSIPSKSVDMILCDLPYGTTACEWDSIIDMSRLWAEYERVIKDNGAIVLTANSHFVFTLHASNPKLYRYKWVWEKTCPYRFLLAHKMPLSQHEDVLIFYKKLPTYNPQMKTGYSAYKINDQRTENKRETIKGFKPKPIIRESNGERFPNDIIKIANGNSGSMHPTQKPVALFEYLIKTYTNEGELVLDNCSGSGTTAIACMNANRRFICIERDETYHRKSIERISNHEPLFHLPTE
jgi:site-specific DNA-methyltransferase (adenine-specific)